MKPQALELGDPDWSNRTTRSGLLLLRRLAEESDSTLCNAISQTLHDGYYNADFPEVCNAVAQCLSSSPATIQLRLLRSICLIETTTPDRLVHAILGCVSSSTKEVAYLAASALCCFADEHYEQFFTRVTQPVIPTARQRPHLSATDCFVLWDATSELVVQSLLLLHVIRVAPYSGYYSWVRSHFFELTRNDRLACFFVGSLRFLQVNATPILQSLLETPDLHIQTLAVHEAGIIGQGAQELSSLILELARERDNRELVLLALYALGRSGRLSPDACMFFTTCIKSMDQDIKQEAVEALCDNPIVERPDTLVQSLMSLVGDSESQWSWAHSALSVLTTRMPSLSIEVLQRAFHILTQTDSTIEKNRLEQIIKVYRA